VKKLLVPVIAGFLLNTVYAQSGEEEDYTVVLPEKAQACVLPAAPDAIPPDADYEQMMVAKQHVADFQSMLGVYRDCLKAAEEGSELTAGNKQALVASYNYSVDMEERVAQRFNEAVHSYKERTAKQ
jgi:hypothetical protein